VFGTSTFLINYHAQLSDYYMIPTEYMRDTLIPCVGDNHCHSSPSYFVHEYPYQSLGRQSSHVLPHFVVFKAGKALSKVEVIPLATVIVQIMNILNEKALLHLISIQDIYKAWLNWSVPPEFRNPQPPQPSWPPSQPRS